MPRVSTVNLYPTPKKGHYIYKQAHRHEKWIASKKYSMGYMKSAVFYSLEDAITWINSLPE